MLQKHRWQQVSYLSLSNSFHDGPKSRDCSNPYWTTMEEQGFEDVFNTKNKIT